VANRSAGGSPSCRAARRSLGWRQQRRSIILLALSQIEPTRDISIQIELFDNARHLSSSLALCAPGKTADVKDDDSAGDEICFQQRLPSTSGTVSAVDEPKVISTF
jgi:hypothetical protein